MKANKSQFNKRKDQLPLDMESLSIESDSDQSLDDAIDLFEPSERPGLPGTKSHKRFTLPDNDDSDLDSPYQPDCDFPNARSLHERFRKEITREPRPIKVLFNDLCIKDDSKGAREFYRSQPKKYHFHLIRAYDLDGNPILPVACRKGSRELVHLLLSKGADINARGKTCGVPIMEAILHHNTPVGKYLLDAGADTRVTDLHDAVPAPVDVAKQRLYEIEQYSDPETRSKAEIQEQAFLNELASAYEDGVGEGALKGRADVHEKEDECPALQSYGFHIECETNDRNTVFSLVERRMQTIVPNSNKTYACLVRGYSHPIRSAVSGWSELEIEKTGGCIDHRIWLDRVFRLCDVMRYAPESHPCDGNERHGAFYASHAEKQLIAFFLYQHTRILDLGFNIVNCSLADIWRPENEQSPWEIKTDIYVSNKPCFDCKRFADVVHGFCGADFRFHADVKHVNAVLWQTLAFKSSNRNKHF